MTKAAKKDANSVDSTLDAGEDVMLPPAVEGGCRCCCRIVHNDGILALNMIGELCENMLGNISHFEKRLFHTYVGISTYTMGATPHKTSEYGSESRLLP